MIESVWPPTVTTEQWYQQWPFIFKWVPICSSHASSIQLLAA
jgi:hypothetical protein